MPRAKLTPFIADPLFAPRESLASPSADHQLTRPEGGAKHAASLRVTREENAARENRIPEPTCARDLFIYSVNRLRRLRAKHLVLTNWCDAAQYFSNVILALITTSYG